MNIDNHRTDREPDAHSQLAIKDTLIDELVTRFVPTVGVSEHRRDSQLAVTVWDGLLDDLEEYFRQTSGSEKAYVIDTVGDLDRHLYRRDGSLHVSVAYEFTEGNGRPVLRIEASTYADDYSTQTLDCLDADHDADAGVEPHQRDVTAIEDIVNEWRGLFGRPVSAWPRWLR